MEEAISLSVSQQFHVERMNRAIESTLDAQQLQVLAKQLTPTVPCLGPKSVMPAAGEENLFCCLGPKKIVKFAQFAASESGVGSRNQVLARLVPTPGPEQVLDWANTQPSPVLAFLF